MYKAFSALAIVFCSLLALSCATTHVYTTEHVDYYENERLVSSAEYKSVDGEMADEHNWEADIPADLQPVADAYALTTVREAQVKSTIDIPYTGYALFRRPLVITKSGVFSLIKCAGYAIGNVGYGLVFGIGTGMFPAALMFDIDGPDAFDYFTLIAPDVPESIANAKEARDAARIDPEYAVYHKPFTKSEIAETRTKSEITNLFSPDGKQVHVIAKDTVQLESRKDITLSAKADSCITSAVVTAVGKVVALPVAVASWLAGCAAGVALGGSITRKAPSTFPLSFQQSQVPCKAGGLLLLRPS